jgi:hypothetical protein
MASTALADGTPVITSFEPHSAPSNGGWEITIHGSNFIGCTPDARICPHVDVGGRPLRVTGADDLTIIGILPSHPAGAASITVTNGDGLYNTASDLFTYVYPQPDPYFEIILFPIARQPFAGEYGASWKNTNLAFNDSDEYVSIDSTCQVDPCPFIGIRPHSAGEPVGFIHAPYDSTDGGLLHLNRTLSGQVHFDSRIEDLSRASLTAGTEIPVIREADLLTGVAELLDVPLDPRFRQTLRIYEPIFGGGSQVAVSFYDMETGILLARQELTFPFPPESDLQPDDLGYLQISDFHGRFPSLALTRRLRIEVVPLTEGLRYWTFVSITNNETQHVTLVTPH